ncbi:MAG TPA: hypothetical protein VGP55_00255 [Chitinophagaceae bacterium]|nr:hypothetical protein [Chitinophagaceae bacterium]
MKKYPVERWHEKIMNDTNIILMNYFLSPKDLEGWLFSHKLLEESQPGVQNIAYFFQRNRNDIEQAIRIDITEADSIKDAEKAFLFMLTDVMAPMEFPESEGNENPGVICYKGFSDIVSLLMFLRGNIVVRVRSIGQKEIPVLDVAKKIDADIISTPEAKDSNRLKLNLDLDAPAEEVLKQLASNSEDSSGKKVYYKIIAPNHRIELSRAGIIHPEPGVPNNIILYAISEEGYVSRVELK